MPQRVYTWFVKGKQTKGISNGRLQEPHPAWALLGTSQGSDSIPNGPLRSGAWAWAWPQDESFERNEKCDRRVRPTDRTIQVAIGPALAGLFWIWELGVKKFFKKIWKKFLTTWLKSCKIFCPKMVFLCMFLYWFLIMFHVKHDWISDWYWISGLIFRLVFKNGLKMDLFSDSKWFSFSISFWKIFRWIKLVM